MKETKKDKKQYPKDYLECCEVMYKNPVENYGKCIVKINDGYKGYEIQTLQKLIFCRDAYWKLYGEEMGFGELWKPNLIHGLAYTIQNNRNEIGKSYSAHGNKVLMFPTEEMRDAFKENFDPDIEICKEFL